MHSCCELGCLEECLRLSQDQIAFHMERPQAVDHMGSWTDMEGGIVRTRQAGLRYAQWVLNGSSPTENLTAALVPGTRITAA